MEHFSVILKSGQPKEQAAVASTLWTLAFDEHARLAIIAEKKCLVELRHLAGETHHDDADAVECRDRAKGALWIIDKKFGSTQKG